MSNNNPRSRNRLEGSPRAASRTQALSVPAVPSDVSPAMHQFLSALKTWMELREGTRGDPYEAAVTRRELADLDLSRGMGGGMGGGGGEGPGLILRTDDGTLTTMTVDEFSQSIFGSRLYQRLVQSLDDQSRFDDLPLEIRDQLLASIAGEAAKRGAEIRNSEYTLQSEIRSLAYKVSEVTAATRQSSAGVRELVFSVAEDGRAQAGKVDQLEASLGNYYQDGTPGRAVLEQTMLVTADRVTGLAAEYMVKVKAGGAVAGFGLAAYEDPYGATESAFIVEADKFALVAPYNFVQEGAPYAQAAGKTWYKPSSKTAYRSTSAGSGSWLAFTPVVPFGVNTLTNEVFINGQVRINAGGRTMKEVDDDPGTTGATGDAVDIVFLRSATQPGTPANSQGVPSGWSATPANVPAGVNPMWSSVGKRATGSQTYVWGAPLRIDGAAVAEVTVFVRSSSAPGTPSGGSYTFSAVPVLSAPSGWSTSVPNGTSPVYTSRAVVSAPSGYTSAVNITGWSAPVLSLKNGDKGDKGDKGDAFYTWIKYATSASGAGLSDSPAGKTYVGFAYNKNTATESNTPSDYTWSLIQGPKGDVGVRGPNGPDGKPTYTWIKYSANANGAGLTDLPQTNTMYIGIATNKTVEAESNTPSDYTWSLFKGDKGVKGDRGDVGFTGQRGSVTRYITGSAWTDAVANAAVPGGTPIEGDTVTMSNGGTYVMMKTYKSGAWTPPGVIIDGSLLVTGSIAASAITAGTLSGFNIQTAGAGARLTMGGSSYAHQLRGYGTSGGNSFYIDATAGNFQFYDLASEGSKMSSSSTLYTLKASNGSSGPAVLGEGTSGPGLKGYSASGYGVTAVGNTTSPPLFLDPPTSKPSNAATGGVMVYNPGGGHRLCVAIGGTWYKIDATMTAI